MNREVRKRRKEKERMEPSPAQVLAKMEGSTILTRIAMQYQNIYFKSVRGGRQTTGAGDMIFLWSTLQNLRYIKPDEHLLRMPLLTMINDWYKKLDGPISWTNATLGDALKGLFGWQKISSWYLTVEYKKLKGRLFSELNRMKVEEFLYHHEVDRLLTGKAKDMYSKSTEMTTFEHILLGLGYPLARPRAAEVAEVCRLKMCEFKPSKIPDEVYYFVTHLLLVDSEWGANELDSDDYAIETAFLVDALPWINKRGRPAMEILGEVLLCLSLFEMCTLLAEEEREVARAASNLLSYEADHHNRVAQEHTGVFLSGAYSVYTKYHSAYCGYIGIIGARNLLC